jgi:hypothetical protein
MRVDTDGDGRGDGEYLTSEAKTFTANIAGRGSTMSMRLVLSFDSDGEGFGVDTFTITGSFGESETHDTTEPAVTTAVPVSTTTPAPRSDNPTLPASSTITILSADFESQRRRATNYVTSEPFFSTGTSFFGLTNAAGDSLDFGSGNPAPNPFTPVGFATQYLLAGGIANGAISTPLTVSWSDLPIDGYKNLFLAFDVAAAGDWEASDYVQVCCG